MQNSGEATESRLIEIETGKLRGVVQAGIAGFKGIPYGQPTSGANRFRGPQPVVPWVGVRDATKLGNPCFQTNPDFEVWVDPMPGSEDCLYLNVWVPEPVPQGARLPVMVWIHGGGYTFGSGGAPLYDGANLARSGEVIVVSINHRLQAFGFTDLSASGDQEFADAGNAGQLDVLAAVRWVSRNIAAFGGDPENVTLFGQSGGGAKISMLMAMPAAKGLFRRAIVQSGSVFRTRSVEAAAAQTERLFDLLGIARNDIAALQAVPADVLLKCGDQIMAESIGTGHPAVAFAPIADDRNLPLAPWGSFAPATADGIPLLLGLNRDETVIYLTEQARAALVDDADVIRAVVEATTTRTPTDEEVADLIPIYRAALPGITNVELVVQLSTDLGFWRGNLHQADLAAQAGQPVFMYRCDWRTPCFGATWAPHGVELPFVLGHPHYGPAWDGTDSDEGRAAADPEGLRFEVGDLMQKAWVNFAKTGNPSDANLAWPAYDVNKRLTLIFDAETRVESDPRGAFRRLVFPA